MELVSPWIPDVKQVTTFIEAQYGIFMNTDNAWNLYIICFSRHQMMPTECLDQIVPDDCCGVSLFCKVDVACIVSKKSLHGLSRIAAISYADIPGVGGGSLLEVEDMRKSLFKNCKP